MGGRGGVPQGSLWIHQTLSQHDPNTSSPVTRSSPCQDSCHIAQPLRLQGVFPGLQAITLASWQTARCPVVTRGAGAL